MKLKHSVIVFHLLAFRPSSVHRWTPRRYAITVNSLGFLMQRFQLGPLEMYLRRYIAGSANEALFFKAAGAIGQRDLQMVNIVVEYLINEGNLSRTLTGFEVCQKVFRRNQMPEHNINREVIVSIAERVQSLRTSLRKRRHTGRHRQEVRLDGHCEADEESHSHGG